MTLPQFARRLLLYGVAGFAILIIIQVSTEAQDSGTTEFALRRAYEIEHRISMMESKLDSIQWIMGFVLGGTITLIGELILRIIGGKRNGAT